MTREPPGHAPGATQKHSGGETIPSPLVTFGLTPGYWLRGQLAYDLREALNTIGDKIAAEVQPRKAA